MLPIADIVAILVVLVLYIGGLVALFRHPESR
jgi:hypothetical protein